MTYTYTLLTIIVYVILESLIKILLRLHTTTQTVLYTRRTVVRYKHILVYFSVLRLTSTELHKCVQHIIIINFSACTSVNEGTHLVLHTPLCRTVVK